MNVDRYGVMGYPVSHSRSPVIHRLFALQTGQDIQYELLQVSPEKLEAAVRQFQRTGGKGLNITVPHKSEVTRLVDQLSERASTAGAVNTLTFREGEILGDNTDGFHTYRFAWVAADNKYWCWRDDVLIYGGTTVPGGGIDPTSSTLGGGNGAWWFGDYTGGFAGFIEYDYIGGSNAQQREMIAD